MLIPLIYPILAGLLAFFVTKTQHFHPDSLIDRFLEYRLSKQLQTYERRLEGEVAKTIVELVTSKIEARSIVLALPPSPSAPVIPQESQAITEPEGPGTKYYFRHYVTALKQTLRRPPNRPLWDCILGMLELVDVIDSFICFCLVLASGLSLRWLFCPALPADGSSAASINRAPSPGPHARRTSTPSDTHKETLLILRPTHKQSGSPNIGVAAVEAQVPLPFATSYQIVVSPSIPSALTSELLRSDPAVLPLPSLSVVSESTLPNQPPLHFVIGNIEIASSRPSVCNSCIRYDPNNATQTLAPPAQEPASLGGTRPLSISGTVNRWNVAAHTVEDLSDNNTSLAGEDLDPSKTESMILTLDSTSFVSDGPSADEVVTPRPSDVNGKSDNIPQENYSSAGQDLDLISCHSKTNTWVEMLSLDSTSFVLSDYVPSSASSDLVFHSSSATSEFDQFSGESGSPVRQDLYFFNSHGEMNTKTLSLDSTPFTPDSCSATHDLSHSPHALEVFGTPSVGQDLEPVNHHLSINPPADHACAPVHDLMPHSLSVVGDPFTSSDSGTVVSSDLEMITSSSSASLDNTRPVDKDEPGQPPATKIEDVSSSTTPGSSADSNAQADHMDLGLNVQTPASKIEGVSSSNSSAGSDTQAINQADPNLKVQTPATKMEDSITPVPLWRQEAMTAWQSRAVNRSSSSNVTRARGNTYPSYLDRRVQVERPWRRSAGPLLCGTPESSRG